MKLLFFMLGLWAMKAFMRQRGWLWKKNLRGKHAFITGAAMGIGRGMARSFAKLGMKLTLADINMKALEATGNPITTHHDHRHKLLNL